MTFERGAQLEIWRRTTHLDSVRERETIDRQVCVSTLVIVRRQEVY